MLGKIEGKRRRGQKRMRWLDSFTDLMDINLSKLWEMVKDKEAWRAAVRGVIKSRTQPSNQTTTRNSKFFPLINLSYITKTEERKLHFSFLYLLSGRGKDELLLPGESRWSQN